MAFVAVYGHVNVDHILILRNLPEKETTVPVERSLVRLGGTGGNIARASASLGVPTALAACVGPDFPPEHRALLDSSGIDLADLRTVNGPTPRVWLLSVPGGSQSAVIDQGVMADGVERPPLDRAWRTAQWVHFTTGSPSEWFTQAKAARADGKKVAFDPAQELSYRYPGRLFEEFLNESDLFLCNETELATGLKLLSYGDAEQLLDHTKTVIVTRGRRGAKLWNEREVVEVPACPVRSRGSVESTGAGDVFRGGLYAALARGRSWESCVRAGAAASSLFLEAQGERFPNWNELEGRLREWYA